jgi:hypothetical protein
VAGDDEGGVGETLDNGREGVVPRGHVGVGQIAKILGSLCFDEAAAEKEAVAGQPNHDVAVTRRMSQGPMPGELLANLILHAQLPKWTSHSLCEVVCHSIGGS